MEASQGGPGGPDAEWVFAYIERHVEALGSGAIFERGKLILLRTCNQLLRRFSQTRRASLCGRILMLLSKMLGMSERSGVNLLGRVHSDNVTELDPEVLLHHLDVIEEVVWRWREKADLLDKRTSKLGMTLETLIVLDKLVNQNNLSS